MNPPTQKTRVREPDSFRHYRRRLTGQAQHLVIHIDADDGAPSPSDLGRNKADLAPTAAQVEDGVALAHVARRVAAAVVAFEDRLRNRAKKAGLVVHRAAEHRFALFGRVAVALPNRLFDVEGVFASHRFLLKRPPPWSLA